MREGSGSRVTSHPAAEGANKFESILSTFTRLASMEAAIEALRKASASKWQNRETH